MLTAERLRELLHYDPGTGVFTWRVSRGGVIFGRRAGTLNHGYVQIKIEGCFVHAHRLAWLHMYGVWPPHDIDHRNGARHDNRACNLRLATRAENRQNLTRLSAANTSGAAGVYWHPGTQKWRAKIMVNYKDIHLGLFTNIDDAIIARKRGEAKYHPFCAGKT